jgi:hypothetical protein
LKTWRHQLGVHTYGHLGIPVPAAPPKEGTISADGLQIYRNHQWKPYYSTTGAEGIARTAPLHMAAVNKTSAAVVRATKAAVNYGVVATPSFQKLFENLRKVRGAAEAADRALAKNKNAATIKRDVDAWTAVGKARAAL